MRILIVYASRHGQTQRVAERLARVARESGAEAHLFEVSALPRNIAPHMCDVVVLASPVYFGKHHKAIERFATGQRTNLAKVKSVFVSVSGAARSPESRAIAEENANAFLGKTGWAPDRVELVAGGEPYKKYGFFTKFIMKRLNRKMGRDVDTTRDYDFTDWNAVDRVGRELAGTIEECTTSSSTQPTFASA